MEDSKNYYSISAVSQSELKLLLNSSLDDYKKNKEKTIQEEYYEDKQHFIIGNAVDMLVTTPKLFKETFHISKLQKKPSDTKIAILNTIIDNIDLNVTSNLNECKEEVYNALNLHSYYLNRKKENYLDDKRVIDFISDAECILYLDEIIKAKNKKILTQEVYSNIVKPIAKSIKEKETLLTELMRENDPYTHIVCEYQKAIFKKIEDVYCKGLLDLIIVNNTTKTIAIVDYKTTSKSVGDFVKTMKERRYDIQHSFYKELLITNSKYSTWNFKYYWIVDSTSFPGNAQIIEAEESVINIGKFGQEGTNIKGWYQGLERWKKLKKSNFTQEYCFLNNNIPKINWDSNLLNMHNHNILNTPEIEY
jgi:hypothetical protein